MSKYVFICVHSQNIVLFKKSRQDATSVSFPNNIALPFLDCRVDCLWPYLSSDWVHQTV